MLQSTVDVADYIPTDYAHLKVVDSVLVLPDGDRQLAPSYLLGYEDRSSCYLLVAAAGHAMIHQIDF